MLRYLKGIQDYGPDWDSEIRSSILYMHFQILILQGIVTQLGQV